ncbi:hypothetical protein CRG98_012569 [Punica granatum]|uniref:Gnk2-homologous domain-containing protein n=1 Tax=Punica granatum TaxID=22663 RepID=A0A2I0KEU3_PUNGR|nr:hypothetical protein CRG98_012569 [Punica granatum]
MPIAITIETSRPTLLTLRTVAFSSPLTPPKSRPRADSSREALALAPPKSPILAQINAYRYNNGNFTVNSTYTENRRLLLSSLPSKVKGNGGFSSALVAQLRTSSIILLFALFYCLAILAQINAHCYNNGNFMANKTYAENCCLLLSALPSKVKANGGFFYGSLGTSPDIVYALIFCRGDLPTQNLTASANSTSMGLMESCPSQKQGAAFESDFCIVCNSDSPIYGILNMNINMMAYNTRDLGISWDSFNQTWWNYMESLASRASKGSTRLKFATGEASLPLTPILFVHSFSVVPTCHRVIAIGA